MDLITNEGFAGIPWLICGIVCIVIATIYYFVWPKKLNPTGISYFILKYFHSLVWILLAMSAFAINFDKTNGFKYAGITSKLALVFYLVFISIFVINKVKSKA